MKQVHPSYSFSASTKTITLTGLNIEQDQLLLIVNATRGVQYFNFADSSLRATVTSGSNTTVLLTDASTTGHANGDALVIYYEDQASSQVVSGTVTANPGTGLFTVSGTVGLDNASLVALENITVTVGSSVAISNVVTVNVATMPAINVTAAAPAVTTVAGTVTIGNFPPTQTIAGTVTANFNDPSGTAIASQVYDSLIGGGDLVNSLNSFFSPQNLISVEVGAFNPTTAVTVSSLPAISGTVTARLQDASGNNLTSTSIGGIQRLNVSLASAATPGATLPTFINVHGGSDSGTVRALAVDASGRTVVTVSNLPVTQAVSLASTTVTVSSLPASTVTVSALPSGALTTRFGSVTTASTAFLTSAVTNTARKYLLAQNISAGTVTIGIGFSPTTTQGIQLAAGAGLTFDSFCPTGGVWWLGAVTGAAFTILEG